MTSPLRDRFGVMLRLELYSPEELCGIVERSAGILNVPCEHEGAFEIAAAAAAHRESPTGCCAVCETSHR